MRKYVLRRLLVAIPSLLIASFVVFCLPRLIPGDVVQLMLDERAYGKDLDDLRAKLGLDRPVFLQYFEWLGRVVTGDLGESLWTKRPVLDELMRRVPITLELGLLALVFAVAIAVPIGVLAATRQDSIADYVFRSLAIVGLSVPGFWKATLIVLLPAIWWGWSPPVHYTEFWKDPGSTSCKCPFPRSSSRSPRRPASCGSRARSSWKSCGRTTCAPPGRKGSPSGSSCSSTV